MIAQMKRQCSRACETFLAHCALVGTIAGLKEQKTIQITQCIVYNDMHGLLVTYMCSHVNGEIIAMKIRFAALLAHMLTLTDMRVPMALQFVFPRECERTVIKITFKWPFIAVRSKVLCQIAGDHKCLATQMAY